MSRFDRLTKSRIGRIVARAHPNWKAVSGRERIDGVAFTTRHHERAMTTNRPENDATGAAAGRVPGPPFQRQIRTSQRRDGNLAFDDQRQRDGILLSSQKAFGTIDGVNGPKSIAIPVCSASIDPLANGDGVGFFTATPNGALHLAHDLLENRRIWALAQFGRIFFGDHRIIGKCLSECAADQSLTAEIRDGNRAFVLLGQHLGRDLGSDGFAELGRFLHRLQRNSRLSFELMVHGSRQFLVACRTGFMPFPSSMIRA